MNKTLFFDVETTGLDAKINDIVQIAGMIDIDGEIVEEFNIEMQPLNWDNVEQEALDIQERTIENLRCYIKPDQAYKELLSIFAQYVNKFDREDKMFVAGYNVNFDLDFLSQFFKKNNDNYLGSFINWIKLDPLSIVHVLAYKGKLKLPNYKLQTVADYFEIKLDNAHDALADVRATRELFYYFMNLKK